MNKPTPKKQIAIKFYNEKVKHISFEAIPDVVEDFRQFGNLYDSFVSNKGRYELYVSELYDFQEVLTYIQNYENDQIELDKEIFNLD